MHNMNEEFEIDVSRVHAAEGSLPTADEVQHLSDFDGEKKKQSSSWDDEDNLLKIVMVMAGTVCVVICGMLVGIAANRNSFRRSRGTSRMPAVVEFLSDNFADRVALEENESPQFKAAQWLADHDGLNVPVPLSTNYDDCYKFVQRYALAVLYYAWLPEQWIFNYQFLSAKDECEWNYQYRAGNDDDQLYDLGVRCNDDQEVDFIFMPANGLEGTMPMEIGLLLALQHLSLFNNRLQGELPAQMMYLTDLKFLALESNRISGNIPEWISEMTSLKFLALGDNKLTGYLPYAFNDMWRLRELSLEKNNLRGSIDIFNNVTSIDRLFLGDNHFTGYVNYEFLDGMENLKELDISGNHFTGYLPEHLLELDILDMHNNEIAGYFPFINHTHYPIRYLLLQENGIRGEIPYDISNLRRLERLDVSGNRLSGEIPDSIGDMDSLSKLYMGDNNFDEGHLPYLGNLTGLREVSFRNTNRIGHLPWWIGEELTELRLLSLDQNDFHGVIPDNLSTLSDLEFLLLDSNSISGTIPQSFRGMSKLAAFRVDNTYIEGDADPICKTDEMKLEIFLGDCDGRNSVFDCECCTNCCTVEKCTETVLPSNDLSWIQGYPKHQAVFSEDIVLNLEGN